MSHWDVFKISRIEEVLQGGTVLFAPPRKAVAFLTTLSVAQKNAPGCFAVCGRRPGLLALDLASIFEKLLDQKNSLPGCFFENG
ncbi:hypothetical protein [Ruminococcus sp.]|uniref:hypothetical protein n=1 Tax=Ruminococcus sp. TaxID=41978 RepID=UPI0025CD0A6B|nr:hypothetical protein [Ruminococcus sp.]